MKASTLIALLWAGLLLGSSFLATPAKFLAPSLSLAQALEVGQVTFGVLMWVEIVALILLSISLTSVKLTMRIALLFFVLVTLIGAQQIFIHPELALRTDAVIRGAVVEPSHLHLVYVASELVKVTALILLALVVNGKQRVCEPSNG